MEKIEVKKILTLIPDLLEVPYSRVWIAYDKEADVSILTSKSRAMPAIQRLQMMMS